MSEIQHPMPTLIHNPQLGGQGVPVSGLPFGGYNDAKPTPSETGTAPGFHLIRFWGPKCLFNRVSSRAFVCVTILNGFSANLCDGSFFCMFYFLGPFLVSILPICSFVENFICIHSSIQLVSIHCIIRFLPCCVSHSSMGVVVRVSPWGEPFGNPELCHPPASCFVADLLNSLYSSPINHVMGLLSTQTPQTCPPANNGNLATNTGDVIEFVERFVNSLKTS